MTQIVKPKATPGKTASAAALIQAVDADDREGSTLKAPLRLEESLDDILLFMQGSIRVDNTDAPRFGVLSLLLQGTPVYVYGHPALKALSKTAFTDGIHIFICDEFMDRLEKDALDSKHQHLGTEVLILHELMHKLFKHVGRLREFPHWVANMAEDYFINASLSLGFPEIKWVKTLSETGLAFRPGEQERYAQLSEVTIAREIMNKMLRKKMEQQDGEGDGNPQPGQPGQKASGGKTPGGKTPGGKAPGQKSQPGANGNQPGQSGPGQPSAKGSPGGPPDPSGQGGGGASDPNGDPGAPGANEADEGEPSDVFSGEGDNHIVDLPTLIKTLEDAGLQAVIDKLNLPRSDDLEEIGKLEAAENMRQNESIQRAEIQRQQLGGKYPGAHIVDSAAEFVRAQNKGKIGWKLGLRELLLGDGQKYHSSMEEPSDVYYVQTVSDMLGTELYLPVELAHKNDEKVVCLFDTSASVSSADIAAFAAEVFELKLAANMNSDAASEVIVLSADTVLRGDPIEINESNVNELMEKGFGVHGRGGTEFTAPCRQLANLPMFKEKKIRAVVYFTDLYAHPPSSLADMGLPEGTKVLFVVAPSTLTDPAHIEKFSKDVESFARVVEIRDGAEANLSETFKDEAVSPSARRRKP